MISIDRAGQNFSVPSGKDHFLYNSLYNRDVEFMKNLIRTSNSGSELERNPNLHMRYSDFDPRSMHDHQSPQSTCPPGLEHQQHLFGPHMLPVGSRSFSCSQSGAGAGGGGGGLMDYPSESIKHHCKSEKHDEEGGGGKCQMHSNSSGGGSDGGGILVKTEFNEMQQSKSSPVHEAYEMTSNAFTSTVLGSGSNSGQFHHDHHDNNGGSPPLPESSASHHHHQHHNHHHLQHHHHSYESYLYASSSTAGRAAMSPRQPLGTMGTTAGGGSEASGSLFHCKSFFADSGSGSSGIAAFYPNNQHHANGETCRDESVGFPNARDSEEKVAIAIKARKMPE